MKLGDAVYVWYFGVRHIGEILKLTPTKARVRFQNCSGWFIEAWRPITALREVSKP